MTLIVRKCSWSGSNIGANRHGRMSPDYPMTVLIVVMR